MGWTTLSLADMDLDAAVAASYAVAFGDRVTTSFGVEDVDGADGVLSNGASGIPLPTFHLSLCLSHRSSSGMCVREKLWHVDFCTFGMSGVLCILWQNVRAQNNGNHRHDANF